jgi:hypothetical protein
MKTQDQDLKVSNQRKLLTSKNKIKMAYALVNVTKPTGSMPGAGGDKKDKITIFRFDDVDVDNFPARDDKGIAITGDIPMTTGKNMVTIYATPSTIVVGQKSEGEEDAKGFTQELKFSHPGSAVEIEEFIQNNLNQNLGAIVEYCSSGRKRLLGSPCAPLQMATESVDDKDKNNTTITLATAQKGSRIAEYEGEIDLGSGSGA